MNPRPSKHFSCSGPNRVRVKDEAEPEAESEAKAGFEIYRDIKRVN